MTWITALDASRGAMYSPLTRMLTGISVARSRNARATVTETAGIVVISLFSSLNEDCFNGIESTLQQSASWYFQAFTNRIISSG